MGVRLKGNPIQSNKENEILTEGIPLGAIQVPGGGDPIISFVEHQTTGGYPKIANVITADLCKVGQLKPGDSFTFQLVSIEEAERLRLAQESFIQSLKTMTNTTAILVTLVIYKIVLILIGLWANKRTKSTSDYFLGGENSVHG